MQEQLKYYPLSNPQKSIWYMEKFFPGTNIAGISATLRLRAPVDFDLLEQAINLTIENNDAIRFQFTTKDGEPVQYIAPYTYQTFVRKDFSGQDSDTLFAWDTEMASTSLFYENAPLYRFYMLQIDRETCGILTVFHHLIADAWGLVLAGDEVLKHYISLQDGQSAMQGPKSEDPQNLKLEPETETLTESSNELNHKTAHDSIHKPEQLAERWEVRNAKQPVSEKPTLKSEQEFNPSYIEYIAAENKYRSSPRFENDRKFWFETYEEPPEVTAIRSR